MTTLSLRHPAHVPGKSRVYTCTARRMIASCMQIVTRAVESAQTGTDGRRTSSASVPNLQQRVELAVSDILRERSSAFTGCLLSFLQSRGSVLDWDRRFAQSLAASTASSGAQCNADGNAGTPRPSTAQRAVAESIESRGNGCASNSAGMHCGGPQEAASARKDGAAAQRRVSARHALEQHRAHASAHAIEQTLERQVQRAGSTDSAAHVLSTSDERRSDSETDGDITS